ncbi:M28 family peptidase [Eudoraea adriatica]|uniref:M28 family peptidase n=1 Tax=Eudoraea adriatica TaxID=446681 RepID=UPI0003810B25|nr:M28 family peptidase [Eudoraea adriatica]
MKKIILGVFFVLALGCKREEPKLPSMEQEVQILASDEFKGRETGTDEELRAAAYIRELMLGIGLTPKGNAGTYYQTFTFKPKKDPHQLIRFQEGGDSTITGTNVIGFIDHGAANTVVIGAHYDHLGLGGEGSLYKGEPAVHNGADDNASGVAVLLDLARKIKETELSKNYLFITFSGEEMGLLGSNFFTKNPTLDLDGVSYMLNLDMVGRLREDKTLSVSGTGTSPIWPQVLNTSNPGFKLVFNESGVGPSDHTSFYLQDIPVLHFFTGQHEDYHKPTDDAEKLNYEGMRLISSYLFNLVKELDDDQKLAFRKTKNESEEVPRFKVALGVVPDYLFDGKGMRIDGISEDKPAQKAGLQKGDIVVRLGDSTVVDMMSYMRALSAFEPGDSTTVSVKRNDQTLKARIIF